MKTRLMGINLLEELERPELAPLWREFSRRRYARGAVVFSPYQEDNLVFVVAAGKARLYLAYDEREFTLSHLVTGDIYTTHTRAWVHALEELELLLMPTERFSSLLADHPALTRTMMLVLGDILQSSLSIINSLVFKDIPKRIAEFLLVAAAEHGEDCSQGRRLRLGVTTEQLATIVGSTRQTVSETLSRLEREGLIRRECRGVFLIPSLQRLESTAATL